MWSRLTWICCITQAGLKLAFLPLSLGAKITGTCHQPDSPIVCFCFLFFGLTDSHISQTSLELAIIAKDDFDLLIFLPPLFPKWWGYSMLGFCGG